MTDSKNTLGVGGTPLTSNETSTTNTGHANAMTTSTTNTNLSNTMTTTTTNANLTNANITYTINTTNGPSTISNDATKTIDETTEKYVYSISGKHFPRFFTQEDFEDIIQNARMRAINSYSSFDPNKGKLSQWLYRIAFNCVLDEAKLKGFRDTIDGDVELINKKDDAFSITDVYGYSGYEWEASRDVTQSEFFNKWYDAVDALSSEEKTIYDYMEKGYKPREIARELNRTPSSISMSMFRIRERLKPCARALAKEYDITFKKAL